MTRVCESAAVHRLHYRLANVQSSGQNSQSQETDDDTQEIFFKGQKAVLNKQIRTTTGVQKSKQFVKNRVSSPLSEWKQDYIDAGECPSRHTNAHVS